MECFFGSIVIGMIKNEQFADLFAVDQKNIRFVHYPDCQQLIIWLPHPGREYGLLRLINTTTGRVIKTCPVADRLSGSIQILWDTFPIPPGNYLIQVERTNGGSHTIEFEKLDENVKPVTQPPASKMEDIKKDSEKPDEPIQYRDGFGNLIENEDLVLRERLIKELAQKF
ncbi:MAG: hypothetical protein SGI83_10360 [Bacteroidota bacterium]|nr:hypothetical protein [Bacteroidota bacterium]